MRERTKCLLKQSAELGAPQVSYSTDELSSLTDDHRFLAASKRIYAPRSYHFSCVRQFY